MKSSIGLLPAEIIRSKRDGAELGHEALAAIVTGLADGSLSEAQAAAFAMAVYFRGMSAAECADLTFAMRDSGEVLDWQALGADRPVLDKHSTGGVGDLVSLALGPMLAACGALVPMVSGRGLGHTGGTLDKLEAIPGYRTDPPREQFVRVAKQAGVAIVGADASLAPADRRLYAIRDVTATVDSIPLITASILSKKLAAGLEGLVLDVKTGNGAVMPELDRATALARSLVETARLAGLRAAALLTDMSQPLAHSAGNGLEVAEAIRLLTGRESNPRVVEVTLELGAELLVLGGLAASAAEARASLEASLASGRAAECFARMVAGLGGPSDLLGNEDRYLAAAPFIREARADEAGFVAQIDTREVGMAVVALGGGRTSPGVAIDPRVGFDRLLPVGAWVDAGTALARIHAADEASAEAATEAIREAYRIAAEAPAPVPLLRRLDATANSR